MSKQDLRTKYGGEDWDKTRQKILERQDYKCHLCAKEYGARKLTSGGLQVHHIEPFEDYDRPSDANRHSNLVALCASHHTEVENSDELNEELKQDFNEDDQ